jgi:hypothetical protein
MQGVTTKNKSQEDLKFNNFSLEDRQKLVSVFAWLIKEDKKQNPALYQSKKIIHD